MRMLHGRMRLGLAAALGLGGLAACAPTVPQIDVTAASGEPNALDSVCRVTPRPEEHYVAVICPSAGRPGEAVVRASLERGYGLRLVPGAGPFEAQIRGGGWGYQYPIGREGEPLRVDPSYPLAAIARADVASCAARFDLTAEGATTNLCVSCAATGFQGAFEDAVRDAISQWRYDAAPGDPEAPDRRNIRVELVLEVEDPGQERVYAPPLPETACPVGVP